MLELRVLAMSTDDNQTGVFCIEAHNEEEDGTGKESSSSETVIFLVVAVGIGGELQHMIHIATQQVEESN